MCPSVTAQGVWRDGVDLVAGWRLLNLTFNFNLFIYFSQVFTQDVTVPSSWGLWCGAEWLRTAGWVSKGDTFCHSTFVFGPSMSSRMPSLGSRPPLALVGHLSSMLMGEMGLFLPIKYPSSCAPFALGS